MQNKFNSKRIPSNLCKTTSTLHMAYTPNFVSTIFYCRTLKLKAMKTLTTIFLMMLMSTIAFGQSKEVEPIKVTPPQFTGIPNAAQVFQQDQFISFNEYLRKNLKYPEEVLRNGAEGTEVVHFEVSADGKLTDFKVINSVSPEIDEAIYDLLKTTCGMWKPGESNGKPVPMKKEIAVEFKWKASDRLNDSKDFEALASHYLKKGHKQLFEKNNPQKALRYYTHGMKYKPTEDCLLLASGMCKYELGDISGAKEDWNRMRISGIDTNAQNLVSDFKNMKGFSQVAQLMKD